MKIPLTQGQVATVDDEDFEWLSESRWHALWAPNSQSFYARRVVKVGLTWDTRLTIRMHQAVWERHNGPIPDGLTIDHADRDTLNDRLSNLRLATRSQQKQNQGRYRNNTSGYRGVHKHAGKWQARIPVDGTRISLGHFPTPVEAARAYDAAAKIHFDPDFVQLNF